MRVFVAGATGVLGRRLVRAFAGAGHAVVGLVRDADGAALVRALGGVPVRADLFDDVALARAADGASVVIHAATAIPTRPTRSLAAWRENDRIRREGTRALARAAAAVGARRYIQQSVVWVVRGARGAYDETTHPDPGPVARSAVDGERIALEIGHAHGVAVTVLRCGVLYAPDAAHTRAMAEQLRARRLPIVGAGATVIAPLHADDAASAFVAAAVAEATGIYHILDDGPLPVGEFVAQFAALLGAPPPRRVPAWLARALLGPAIVETIGTPMATSNARARRELAWRPRFPTSWYGLRDVLAAWERGAGTVYRSPPGPRSGARPPHEAIAGGVPDPAGDRRRSSTNDTGDHRHADAGHRGNRERRS